ncbi:Farnesoate epoxidase [Orchesella cincta]|uniref:Farnesoate epoxidase n=1 Tax=Orchesella cincta TaxID=48709 RepID=A0A1D2NMB9_ORCCI|nr:Farnesoate epoxidase [Orchesella cincta]
MITEIFILALVLFIYRTLFRKKEPSRLPSGPRSLPLLGNMLDMKRNGHLKLSEWAEEYGPLYTVRIGMKPALVVSDTKLLKELFGHAASTGKFKTDTIFELTKGAYGVVSTEGELWHEQRQFLIRTLINFGFGKPTMEPIILSDVQEAIDWIKKDVAEQGTVEIFNVFKSGVTNALWCIVSGDRQTKDDHTFSLLIDAFVDSIQNSVKSGLFFLSWLKTIAPEASGYNWLVKTTDDLHDYVGKLFDKHRESFTPGSPRDVIDCYLEKLHTTTDPKSTFYGDNGKKNALATIIEIFEAGLVTSSHTLNWLTLYLTHHQDVQAKLHAEIDRVVGRNRDPSLQDKAKMPYTEAVILETLRITSLVPLGVMHELLYDIDFHGYRLPKGLLLVPNMYHVHHDKKIWGDPENFRPERFLEEDESKLIRSDSIIRNSVLAFQMGQRKCLGEPLAKDVLFLYVSKIFQNLHASPDPSSPKPNFEYDDGIVLIANKFRVVMDSR